MELVCSKHQLTNPFSNVASDVWYVLIEAEIHQEEEIPYMDFINSIADFSIDVLYSTTESIKKGFFRFREDISEAVAMSGRFHKNDISIPISYMDQFIKNIKDLVNQHYKDYQLFLFGHAGDGNIHVNLLTSYEKDINQFKKEMQEFDLQLYGMIKHYNGSISAEHGIGLLKKPYLLYTRSPEEIEYMKSIKKIFDPNNILNPGKIFDL